MGVAGPSGQVSGVSKQELNNTMRQEGRGWSSCRRSSVAGAMTKADNVRVNQAGPHRPWLGGRISLNSAGNTITQAFTQVTAITGLLLYKLKAGLHFEE